MTISPGLIRHGHEVFAVDEVGVVNVDLSGGQPLAFHLVDAAYKYCPLNICGVADFKSSGCNY